MPPRFSSPIWSVVRVDGRARGFSLTFKIGGGYAFIVDRRRTHCDVASITLPLHAPAGFKEHRLTVVLVKGQVDPTASLPPTNLGEPGKPIPGWDLTGFRVEVWPDGHPLATGLTGLNAPDRAFLPNIPVLGGQPLDADWPSLVEARLTLRSGLLFVEPTDLSQGVITLQRPDGANIPAQRFCGGIQGFHCVMSNLNVASVTLALFPITTTDAQITAGANPVGKIVFTPVQDPGNAVGQIILQVNSREGGGPQPGDVLTEFGLFYELLDPKPTEQEQFIPLWDMRGSVDVTPGSECPPGFFESP